MILKQLIAPSPILLTVLPTHKCSASCDGCCFGCSPNVKYIMPCERVISHIDEVVSTFPSIRVLVVSGGECSLIGDDLNKIISHGASKGLVTRIVTNAHWANSYKSAYNMLAHLKTSGLCELNISTGQQHKKYVNSKNIINAVLAAIDIGICPIHIAYEKHPDISYENEEWYQNDIIQQFISEQKVKIIEGPWNKLQGKDEIRPQCKDETFKIGERCKNIYNYITINPYSQLLACCGLTSEYNKFLKLGSLLSSPLKDLYDSQFEDLFLLWLYTLGPKYIYLKLSQYNRTVAKTFSHPCIYCAEIARDITNIKALRILIKEEIPTILFNLELINRKLKY